MPDAARCQQEIHDPDRAEGSRAALEIEMAALRARVAELEQLRVRLEDFAALVAHELVKPLALRDRASTKSWSRQRPSSMRTRIWTCRSWWMRARAHRCSWTRCL